MPWKKEVGCRSGANWTAYEKMSAETACLGVRMNKNQEQPWLHLNNFMRWENVRADKHFDLGPKTQTCRHDTLKLEAKHNQTQTIIQDNNTLW